MVISRRGGGLCLILGDPIKRRDLVSHTMNIIPEVDTKTDLISPAGDEVSRFAQASGSGRDPSWGRSLMGAGPRRLGPGLYQRGDASESWSDGKPSRKGNNLCDFEPCGPLLRTGDNACLLEVAVEMKVNGTGSALGMWQGRINVTAPVFVGSGANPN